MKPRQISQDERDSNHGQATDPSRNGGIDAEDPLDSAIAQLERVAGTTGEERFELRQEAAVLQRGELIRWAETRRLILDPSGFGGTPRTGGAEHDVWTEGAEFWKITRPDHFGWTVLPGDDGDPYRAYATPLEYLERWRLANELFGDRARLRGIVICDQGVSVVISHPAIGGADAASYQIRRLFEGFGFRMVPGFALGASLDSSFYHPELRMAVFDAAGDNFVVSRGMPVPVDVMVLNASDRLHAQLLSMIGR